MAEKKKNPKQKASEQLNKYKEFIQDRVAGFGITEIAERHKTSRQTVHDALTKHNEEFEEARKLFLDERQSKINAIFDKHNEQLALLLQAGTKNLAAMIARINTELAKEDYELKPLELAKLSEAVAKIYSAVDTSVMNRQKEATK